MKRFLIFLLIFLLLPTLCLAELSVLFVNVGKADAAIVRFDDYTALVDCGKKDTLTTLLSALSQLKLSSIDEVFFSHSHADHTGAFKKLCKSLPVRKFYHSVFPELTEKGKDFFENLSGKTSVPHETLRAGEVLTPRPGLSIEVLGPTLASSDYNDQSLVLRFSAYGRGVLFTGDMQFTEELYLLRSSASLSADILKASNHANPDSNSESFLNAVSPSVAVISTDTRKDADSANRRIISHLTDSLGCEVYLTQDAALGILVIIHEDGRITVETLN